MQLSNRIRIVLVNTSQPGNIGGSARAMLNMGFARLYLVNPEIYPSDRALWRAAGARSVLDQARVCQSLAEAVGDCHLIVGTSARERRIPWPLVDPAVCAERVLAEPDYSEIALVFGREDSGLTNDELQQCHLHVHIPSNPDYSSLNLSAAVQVLCYAIRHALLSDQGELPIVEQWDEPFASQRDVDLMIEHLEAVMVKTGFHDPDNPRQTMTRVRRLFSRIRPDESEIQILRGFLSSVEK